MMHPYWFFSLLLLALIGRVLLLKFIREAADRKSVDEKRRYYVSRAVDGIFFVVCLVIILTYSGLDFDDVGLFLGSIVAVLGVALFAQWSILSNITASLVIFFFFPYRVGDQVTILDGDNSVQGTIKEIALFHVILSSLDDPATVVTFPTSLIFQKAVTVRKASVSEDES